MCLHITKNVERDTELYLKTAKRNKKGYLTAYKIFTKGIGIRLGIIETPFQRSICVSGLNVSSRTSKQLGNSEFVFGSVVEGFHSILDVDVKNIKNYLYEGEIIRKVYFRPEWVVAVGIWRHWQNIKSIVTTKLIMRFD
jgi:hypothetical protein